MSEAAVERLRSLATRCLAEMPSRALELDIHAAMAGAGDAPAYLSDLEAAQALYDERPTFVPRTAPLICADALKRRARRLDR